MLKKGNKFRIDWDKLIAAAWDDEMRGYLESQKSKYGGAVFTACKVRRGRMGSGYIVEYSIPDQPELFSGVGIEFVIRTKGGKRNDSRR